MVKLDIELCILYFMITLKLQTIFAECPNYYTLLEITDDDIISPMAPKKLDAVIMEYPMFNDTEEYNILKDNRNCFIELNCDEDFSESEFLSAKKINYTHSTDIRYEEKISTIPTHVTSSKNFSKLIDASNSTNVTSATEAITPTNVINSTESSEISGSSSYTGVTNADTSISTNTENSTESVPTESTTTELPEHTVEEITSESTTLPYESSTIPDYVETALPYESSTIPDYVETTTNIDGSKAALENKDTNSFKKAVIITSVLGGACLLGFVTVKGITALQSGVYRL